MCAADLAYALLVVPTLMARVRYVPICTAHSPRPRDAQETRKAVTTHNPEKRQSDPQKGSHITGSFSIPH